MHFTLDLFYAMAQIHNLVDVNWFFGIPFLATDADGNAGLVVQNAMSILGSKLLGLQMANEPDLYVPSLHGRRLLLMFFFRLGTQRI